MTAAAGVLQPSVSGGRPARTDWHIDAVSGSDSGQGSASDPIATFAELEDRLGPHPLEQAYTIHIDADTNELMEPRWALRGGTLTFSGGEAETLFSGTLTGFAQVDASTNSEAQVEISGVDFTSAGPGGSSLISYHLIVEDGAAAGASCVLLRQTSTGVVVSSIPTDSRTGGPVTLAGNESVRVVRYRGVGLVYGTSHSLSDFPAMIIEELEFTTALALTGDAGQGWGPVEYWRCRWPSTAFVIAHNVVRLRGCSIGGLNMVSSTGRVTFDRSGCKGTLNIQRATLLAALATVVEGGLISGANALLDTFDVQGLPDPEPALSVSWAAGAGVALSNGANGHLDDGTTIMGHDNGGWGMVVAGGSFIYDLEADMPNITGASGDVIVGGESQTWAGLATSDGVVSANGSRVVQKGAPAV